MPTSQYYVYPSNDIMQVDGSAITRTSTDYNGGAAKQLGTAASAILTNVNHGEKSHDLYGSRQYESAGYNQKAVSAGNWATMTAEKFVIAQVCDELAGVSNTVLQSMGTARLRLIHQKESLRTVKVATAIRANNWNPYSGSWDSAPGTANDWSTAITTQTGDGGGTNQDDAANPSRTKPGELVYKTQAEPTQDDYSAKTGG